MPARRTAHRNLGCAIHGAAEGFSLARARSEVGRADAADEIPNRFVVADGDLTSSGLIHSTVANSKKRRPRRGPAAFHQRQLRRAERSRAQSSQHGRQRFAVPGTSRREEGRRHSRRAPVFSHLWIDRYPLVPAYRGRAHCHLSKSPGSREECSIDRKIQTDSAARDPDISARLFAQGRTAPAAQFATRYHWCGETSSRSCQKFRGPLQTKSL